jgi:hypothetical protein|tara:strand:+ start:505 stop:705 length:201 start_codon:yes stop_codon:yes gene_type:complete
MVHVFAETLSDQSRAYNVAVIDGPDRVTFGATSHANAFKLAEGIVDLINTTTGEIDLEVTADTGAW